MHDDRRKQSWGHQERLKLERKKMKNNVMVCRLVKYAFQEREENNEQNHGGIKVQKIRTSTCSP